MGFNGGFTRTFVHVYILSLLLDVALSQSDCNYFQNMEPGQAYYVYNREYPNPYKGENSCVWQTASNEPMQVNCTLEMGSAPNCNGDQLSIRFSESDENRYCGYGSFKAKGNNVTIRFQSPKSTKLVSYVYWFNTPRIVGGIETGVNEYPMMAGLVDYEERELYCGATIISPEYVITAAHCVVTRKISSIGVIIGEHSTTTGSDTDATKLFRINKCIAHPEYDDDTSNNNVAICQIIGTIQYSAKVGPVCLPFLHKHDNFVGSTVTALGWGLLEFGGPKSDVLRGVSLNVVADCSRYYPIADISTLCTFTPGRDTCQMDSGGPLLWQNPTTGRLVLAGITSGGIGCASDKPSFGIRIGHYVDWIQSVTPGVRYCKIE